MRRSRGTGRRVLPWLALVMGTTYVAIGGVVAVLLPAQVERIEPDDKVAALGVIASLSFAVTVFAQPLIGGASDRTRSRFPARLPWVVGSAVVGALAVAAMGWAGSLLALAVLWALAQFALNGVDIVASTAVVDDYPPGGRGRPSGVLAASIAVGTALGAVLSGALAAVPVFAFAALAGIALLGAVTFTLGRPAPQRPGDADPTPRPRAGSGRIPTDYLWAILTRFSFTFGQQAVSTYLLYILSDHVGLGPEAAPALVGALTGTGILGLLAGALLAGWWSDRFGTRRMLLVVSSAIFVLAMVVVIVAPLVPVMFVYAVLQGAALGVHLAAAGSLLADVLPAGDRRPGRDLGVANTVVNAAQALAPLAAGALVLATGGYLALFLMAIAAAGLSAVAATRVRGIR